MKSSIIRDLLKFNMEATGCREGFRESDVPAQLKCVGTVPGAGKGV